VVVQRLLCRTIPISGQGVCKVVRQSKSAT
jgi:hypothetical protein